MNFMDSMDEPNIEIPFDGEQETKEFSQREWEKQAYALARWRTMENKPWSGEPDFKVESYKGFGIVVNRNDLGFLCGYVVLPITHKLAGESFWDMPYLVHGGVTYCGPISNLPFEWSGEAWAIGFDCGHYGDLIPFHECLERPYHIQGLGGTYRNMDYVIGECVLLIDQILGEFIE